MDMEKKEQGIPSDERKYPSYSVLMSVYAKEVPAYFEMAIQSMLEQTIATDDFVIVCDGPLSKELDDVIAKYVDVYSEVFNILRLEKNQGLGNALNAGLDVCRYDLVARMDSDDISLPYRCEYQLKAFIDNPQLAFCSGDIAEFVNDPNSIQSIRRVPKTHADILKIAKRRNPMNHVAVMFSKMDVKDVGGYIDIKLAEDYYLWVRMLQKGYKAINVERILVKVRIGNGMYERRGGLRYARSMCDLQTKFLQLKFISYPDYIINCFIRIAGSIMPTSWRQFIYQTRLRQS